MSNEEEDIGTCARILSETKYEEEVCGEPAEAEVLVRNKFSLYAVLLCRDCLRDHKEFYIELREKQAHASASNNRRRITQSRGSRV